MADSQQDLLRVTELEKEIDDIKKQYIELIRVINSMSDNNNIMLPADIEVGQFNSIEELTSERCKRANTSAAEFINLLITDNQQILNHLYNLLHDFEKVASKMDMYAQISSQYAELFDRLIASSFMQQDET